jgi:hypothetical protein
MHRCMPHAMFFAVTGVPSSNFTPGRMVKVHRV